MDHKTYMTVSAAIFGLVALLHLARVILGWEAAIGGWEVPMWLSWIGLVVAGFLAYTGYKHQR